MPGEISLAPGLLIAMPQLQDPNFRKAVVLMLEHDERGSFGLVINRPSEARLSDLLDGIEIEWKGPINEAAWRGGPVQPETGWILHESIPELADVDGTLQVADDLFLSSAPSALRLLAERPPRHLRFMLGYAGWGPGQLEEELTAGAWVNAEASAELLFDTPSSSVWDESLRRMGIDPSALVPAAGVH